MQLMLIRKKLLDVNLAGPFLECNFNQKRQVFYGSVKIFLT